LDLSLKEPVKQGVNDIGKQGQRHIIQGLQVLQYDDEE
jgi:hypothetical protein